MPAAPDGTDDPDDPIDRARRRGRAARAALAGDDRAEATDAAVAALLALPELAQPTGSGRIGLSASVRDELDLGAAASALRSRGWSTWLPSVVADGTGQMEFLEWRAGDVLEPGSFGVDEPPRDGRTALIATALEVVVAPCVAVDEHGTRVGYGAGFYDRALAGHATIGEDRRPVVVVAAFDAQVQPDELPRRVWDVPGDVVVTDRRTIRTGR